MEDTGKMTMLPAPPPPPPPPPPPYNNTRSEWQSRKSRAQWNGLGLCLQLRGHVAIGNPIVSRASSAQMVLSCLQHPTT